MATLILSDEQVLELVRQLSTERRRWLFRQLLQDEWPAWHRLSAYGAERVRQLASARNLDWDQLSERERASFVDDLLHEDMSGQTHSLTSDS